MNKTEYYPDIKLQRKYKRGRIASQRDPAFWIPWVFLTISGYVMGFFLFITCIGLVANILFLFNFSLTDNLQLLLNFILWISAVLLTLWLKQKMSNQWLRPSVMVDCELLRPYTDESLVLYNDGIGYSTDIVDLFLPYSRVKRIEFDEKTSSIKVIGSVKGVYLATYKGEKEGYARTIRDENNWRVTISPYYYDYENIVEEICSRTAKNIYRKESLSCVPIEWADIFC